MIFSIRVHVLNLEPAGQLHFCFRGAFAYLPVCLAFGKEMPLLDNCLSFLSEILAVDFVLQ